MGCFALFGKLSDYVLGRWLHCFVTVDGGASIAQFGKLSDYE